MTFQRSNLNNWLVKFYGSNQFKIDFLAGDASFRRYYRVYREGTSCVLMDASSEKDKLRQFLTIGNLFKEKNVLTPEVLYADLEEGLCLLSDFGNCLLFDVLDDKKTSNYLDRSLNELIKINQIDCAIVPEYTHEKFIEEAYRMNEWFFELIKIKLSEKDQLVLKHLFYKLADLAKTQPQVCLHRDYHSKNIMLLEDQRLGIIDYQDAVCGPVAYDLVSLLKDCYVSWPNQLIDHLIVQYFQMLQKANVIDKDITLSEFKQWFDWVGMQRHIKCLGIFACLYIRDGRPGYLEHIPRVMNYILDVAKNYDNLKDWYHLLLDKIQPNLEKTDLKKIIEAV